MCCDFRYRSGSPLSLLVRWRPSEPVGAASFLSLFPLACPERDSRLPLILPLSLYPLLSSSFPPKPPSFRSPLTLWDQDQITGWPDHRLALLPFSLFSLRPAPKETHVSLSSFLSLSLSPLLSSFPSKSPPFMPFSLFPHATLWNWLKDGSLGVGGEMSPHYTPEVAFHCF